jgi:hypothetical protein
MFRIVHVFWTTCRSVDELVSISWSDLRQSFGITSCCSLDTQSPYSDVYLENSGEVLSKLCLDRIGAWKLTHIRFRGLIRTYPHLVDSRITMYMDFMVHIPD